MQQPNLYTSSPSVRKMESASVESRLTQGMCGIGDIQRAVAAHYDVPLRDLLSTRRDRRTVRPRQIAMWIARRVTARTLPEIGRRFDRDHTTVIHAVGMIDRMIADDPCLAREILALAAPFEPGEEIAA